MTDPTTAVTLRIRATYVGERLDVRGVSAGEAVAWSPAVLRLRDGAWAVLFRYGAVVLAGLEAHEEEAFLASLASGITRPCDEPQLEDLPLVVDPDHEEGLDQTGTLWVKHVEPRRLQVVAEVLAKSTALAHYETEVGEVFTQLEPLLEGVRHGRRSRSGKGKILSQLAQALSTQARLIGRVEVTEKPDITWDDPELDRLYERLAAEFELSERVHMLTRKTDFISESADILIGMAQHRQTLRVEWYIVILIVIEIVLLVFDLSTR